MRPRTRSTRRAGTVLATGLTAALLAGGATAWAAPPAGHVNGNGRAQVGNDEIRLSLNIRAGLAFNGSLSYYDGRRWLVSTGTCGFKINGRVAKLKGVGRWGSRDVVYYLQVKDRSPKRADTMSIKVKAGKSVVLRQSAALTSGDLAVHG